MWKAALKGLLGTAGFSLVRSRGRYHEDGLFTIHNDGFRRDPEFRRAYARGLRASNGIDPGFEWRVHAALWAAGVALRVPGDFVECGVNAGFMSSAILERWNWNATGRRFFLIDTFTGPVLEQFSAGEVDRGRRAIAEQAVAAGAYVTDLDRIRANYREWPGAVIVPGAVPEVLPCVDTEAVAFLHLDMNCAYPERAALEYFWPKMAPGGVALLDDYAYFGHEEQAGAMGEAARRLGVGVLSLPTGQGLIIHE
jgi:hypothetical protein